MKRCFCAVVFCMFFQHILGMASILVDVVDNTSRQSIKAAFGALQGHRS
jgi:hypothetical protein